MAKYEVKKDLGRVLRMKKEVKVVSRDSQVSLESTFQTKLAIRDFPKTEESFARNNLKLESGDEGY